MDSVSPHPKELKRKIQYFLGGSKENHEEYQERIAVSQVRFQLVT
jgi:truncated hemoglobin YjbI